MIHYCWPYDSAAITFALFLTTNRPAQIKERLDRHHQHLISLDDEVHLIVGEAVMIQAEAFLDVKKWGNDLGVRLPMAIARAAHLHANQRVHVAVEDGRVIITPVDHAEPTLEERLAKFDPTRHRGEAMVAEQVGAEKW